MYNIIALVAASIIIPFVVVFAVKLYQVKNLKKVMMGLIIAILSCELLRFFYTASLYPNAVTPTNDVIFSYLTFLLVFGLFAVFSKGKLGQVFKVVFGLTALVPMAMGIVTTRVYDNVLDAYVVGNALYFVSTGLSIALAVLMIIDKKNKFSLIDLLIAVVVYCGYIGIFIGTIFSWKLDIKFDLNFYLSIILTTVSIPVAYLGSLLYYLVVDKVSNNSVSKTSE